MPVSEGGSLPETEPKATKPTKPSEPAEPEAETKPEPELDVEALLEQFGYAGAHRGQRHRPLFNHNFLLFSPLAKE